MARFLALDFPAKEILGWRAVRFFALFSLAIFSSTGQRVAAQATPTATGTTTSAAKAPASQPAPQDNRYGKILTPTDDAAHPVKLNIQFPGVGEMKIPSQEELNERMKLEQLATLSDDEIRAQLALWPPFAKMKLGDEGQMLMRIQQFKDQRTRIAMDKARELGIVNSMTPDQKVRFEKEYWDKRLQMDRVLAKQFEPVFKTQEEKLEESLFRDFAPPGTTMPITAGAKPPVAPVAQAKPTSPTAPPAATPAPVAQNPVH